MYMLHKNNCIPERCILNLLSLTYDLTEYDESKNIFFTKIRLVHKSKLDNNNSNNVLSEY